MLAYRTDHLNWGARIASSAGSGAASGRLTDRYNATELGLVPHPTAYCPQLALFAFTCISWYPGVLVSWCIHNSLCYCSRYVSKNLWNKYVHRFFSTTVWIDFSNKWKLYLLHRVTCYLFITKIVYEILESRVYWKTNLSLVKMLRLQVYFLKELRGLIGKMVSTKFMYKTHLWGNAKMLEYTIHFDVTELNIRIMFILMYILLMLFYETLLHNILYHIFSAFSVRGWLFDNGKGGVILFPSLTYFLKAKYFFKW